MISYPACLVNVPVDTEGLKTRCWLYLDKRYHNDPDIMDLVVAKYEFEDQFIDACRKRESILKKLPSYNHNL